ncbi:apolipoprotein A-I-like [Symphorus nematophorus]
MKFAVLALALLLAVGSHAASLQADAPSQLQHMRSLMDLSITQMKDSIQKALAQLDDTEYSELKKVISVRMDDLHNHIKVLQASISPLTDSVFATIIEATSDFRASIEQDIQSLQTEIEPQRLNLKSVIHRHIEEYRAKLEPIITEYYAKQSSEVEGLKTRLQPVVEELQEKVATNLEETKRAIMPIVEAVRTKINERLEQLKGVVTPYVDEYKDQLRQTYEQAQQFNPDEFISLRRKIEPLVEDVRVKLRDIFNAIAGAVTKQ